MTEPVPTKFCPRCRATREAGLLKINHASRGTVFNGCADCIIGELDALALYRSTPCYVCGAEKETTRFAGSGERLECPVHVHGRPLLARSLTLLRMAVESLVDHPHKKAFDRLCLDLVDALGVAQKQEASDQAQEAE